MDSLKKAKPLSDLRQIYTARLVGRCIILVLCTVLCLTGPQELAVLHGWGFFRGFSVLHLLWGVWVADMLAQLLPVLGAHIALGSHKLFRRRFRPAAGGFDRTALRRYIARQNKRAGLIFMLWAVLTALIGVCHRAGLIDDAVLFLISVFFYVCDLICVLIWCPFRLVLGNRCCTTCRIFNWDHLMMFSPLIFVGGFYAGSLLALAALVWLMWELAVLLHPERFWAPANDALKCSQCTDKLCIQYCEKRLI